MKEISVVHVLKYSPFCIVIENTVLFLVVNGYPLSVH